MLYLLELEEHQIKEVYAEVADKTKCNLESSRTLYALCHQKDVANSPGGMQSVVFHSIHWTPVRVFLNF